MAMKDFLGRATRAGATAADALSEEKRRRERRAQFTEQARQELRDEAARAREARARQTGSAGPKPTGDTGGHRQGGDTGGHMGTSDCGRPAGQAAGARVCHYKGRVVADYYETLEVSPRARPAVIDKAYRALMREVHPDQGGDARKAQAVNEAYEVLRDPATRRAYDLENDLG